MKITIEKSKNFNHIIGKEFKEEYDEYTINLAESEIWEIVREFERYKDNNEIDIDDFEKEEIEDATSLKVGSYSFNIGDFTYYITVE